MRTLRSSSRYPDVALWLPPESEKVMSQQSLRATACAEMDPEALQSGSSDVPSLAVSFLHVPVGKGVRARAWTHGVETGSCFSWEPRGNIVQLWAVGLTLNLQDPGSSGIIRSSMEASKPASRGVDGVSQ